ncbi:hypothetical protein SAY87_012631 [Trapa incisa]|uniref:Uncharacterized protein n=1 Tax=Trapa incisa TaxID=236973 RepID=A0AAN7JJ16_9MYRT|nr:hypothetical protein SAY87_012631 [Trapa incisa]
MVGILKGVRGSCLASGHGAWALQSCVVITVLIISSSGSGYLLHLHLLHHGLHYVTGSHFAATALVGLASDAAGYSASNYASVGELLIFANVSITGMNLSLTLNYCSGTSSPVWIAYILRQLNFRDISQYLWTYRFGECFL